MEGRDSMELPLSSVIYKEMSLIQSGLKTGEIAEAILTLCTLKVTYSY